MKIALIVAFSLVLSLPVFAQDVVLRSGKDCPVNYYRSGNYCVAHDNNSQAVSARGDSCPWNHYKSGDYCLAYSSPEKSKKPVEKQGDCPIGYYKSNDYCMPKN